MGEFATIFPNCNLALFGSYFAYEDYQDSEYDEGDAESSDGRYIAGNGGVGGKGGSASEHYGLNGRHVVKTPVHSQLDHQPKPSQMV